MAGVTDTVFRRFIRNLSGCGLIMTEFTSSHGVSAAMRHAESKKPNRTVARYLGFDSSEHPISAQLFGADPKIMADAARVCQDLGFDILDINFGCPVNKVVKCNGGSGLLRDLPLVEEILTEVRKAISIPFTCKFRAGWNDQELVMVEMARLAENCGLQAIALHPRTREQGYGGKADWTRIAAIKDCAGVPDTTLALILDGRLKVLAGNDDAIFASIYMGGAGAISAAAHVRPERFVAMYQALTQGDLAQGRAIYHELAPLLRALASEPNPAPVKAALAAQGWLKNELRSPMTPVSDTLMHALTGLAAA